MLFETSLHRLLAGCANSDFTIKPETQTRAIKLRGFSSLTVGSFYSEQCCYFNLGFPLQHFLILLARLTMNASFIEVMLTSGLIENE